MGIYSVVSPGMNTTSLVSASGSPEGSIWKRILRPLQVSSSTQGLVQFTSSTTRTDSAGTGTPETRSVCIDPGSPPTELTSTASRPSTWTRPSSTVSTSLSTSCPQASSSTSPMPPVSSSCHETSRNCELASERSQSRFAPWHPTKTNTRGNTRSPHRWRPSLCLSNKTVELRGMSAGANTGSRTDCMRSSRRSELQISTSAVASRHRDALQAPSRGTSPSGVGRPEFGGQLVPRRPESDGDRDRPGRHTGSFDSECR
jgi:hypothetical protein